jgi:hypothetical protein
MSDKRNRINPAGAYIIRAAETRPQRTETRQAMTDQAPSAAAQLEALRIQRDAARRRAEEAEQIKAQAMDQLRVTAGTRDSWRDRVTELEREVGELKLRVAEAVDVSAYEACEECSIAREKAETQTDELRAMLERVLEAQDDAYTAALSKSGRGLEAARRLAAAQTEARALLDRTAGTEAR